MIAKLYHGPMDGAVIHTALTDTVKVVAPPVLSDPDEEGAATPISRPQKAVYCCHSCETDRDGNLIGTFIYHANEPLYFGR